LLVKGDLLLRFPTTLIFAARARWTGPVKNPVPPAVVDPASTVLPDLQVDVAPGVRLLGFPIPYKLDAGGTENEAAIKAAVGAESPPGDPGWFFVIQEHPTEPRFGLNVSATTPLFTWRKVSWPNMTLRDGSYINVGKTTISFATLPSMKKPANTKTADETAAEARLAEEKAKATWGRTSADMAYITLQQAYRLEVHAGHWLIDVDAGHTPA
jgi:hypothetical protein